MIRFLRIAILLVAFVIDVDLNAEAIFYPKNCWGKDSSCAVQNDSKQAMALHLKGLSVHMDSQAILKTVSENEAILTRGTLFAQHGEDFRWTTPFGQVVCRDCEVLLQRDEKRLEVHAIKGQVLIVRKGDTTEYELPPGFSVELSTVEHDGKANLDFPQASPLVLIGKAWAKVYSEDPGQFKKEFGDYVETWTGAADLSSQMQQDDAKRLIASDVADHQRLEKIHQIRLQEQERLRNLFKEKNYLQ